MEVAERMESFPVTRPDGSVDADASAALVAQLKESLGLNYTEGTVADGEHLELLGGHLIGPDVSELLPELTLAQKWDLTVNELARNVHTHPTMSEAMQETFHGAIGHMINL